MSRKVAAEELRKAVEEKNLKHVTSMLNADPSLADDAGDDVPSIYLQAFFLGAPEIAAEIGRYKKTWTIGEAAGGGYVERLLNILGESPMSIDQISPDGFTALHIAAFLCRDRAINVLLAHGADPNAVAANESEVTPIHSAAASRNSSVVNMLLAGGANPNAQQKGGYTALHSASRHALVSMVQSLLLHGASRDLAADDGKTAFDFGLESKNDEVLRLLKDQN